MFPANDCSTPTIPENTSSFDLIAPKEKHQWIQRPNNHLKVTQAGRRWQKHSVASVSLFVFTPVTPATQLYCVFCIQGLCGWVCLQTGNAGPVHRPKLLPFCIFKGTAASPRLPEFGLQKHPFLRDSKSLSYNFVSSLEDGDNKSA